MNVYIKHRFLLLLPVLLGITFFTFVLMQLPADDTVDMMYKASGAVSETVKAAARAELGLDRPLLVRYLDWLLAVCSGDMGRSYISGTPVTALFVAKLQPTLYLTALALLLCVIGVGVYLTVTMLFKINTLEVAVDGEVVQEVGGYSSAEILQALGVHAEENIFSFDPAEKAAALEKQFPLLENIRVERDYPNTVVVRTNAAAAVYAMQTSGGWLSLSAGLKILDQDSAQPDLIILCGGEPVSATPGTQLEFETGPSGPSSGSAASDSAASSEAGPPTDKRLESLNTLLTALDSSELGADVTRIEFEDPEQMAFLYQGRISVLLGTLNELDYKLRLAKYVLLNEDGKGCSPTDTGMLDLSHLSASSSRKFRFAQGEPTLPSGWTAPEEPAAPAEAEAESQPEEAPGTEPDTEGAEATPAEDPTAAAAEQQ